MSSNDLHLLSHTNYTLLKFFTAFKKTNVEKVVKTIALTNNIISFSRDQLKQSKGLDMLHYEKEVLRKFMKD